MSELSPFAGSAPLTPVKYEPVTFQTQTHILASLCEKAGAVVPTREFSPVLRNLAISIAPGSLSVRGTDLELAVVATSAGISTTDTATIVIPATRLRAILKEAPPGNLQVDVAGDQATLYAGQSTWTMHLGDDPSDFPKQPDLSAVQFVEVERTELLRVLRAVRHAVCKDGARPHLMQVGVKDGTVTATDNVRASQALLPGFPLSFSIPAAGSPSAVDELMRILGASDSEKVKLGQSAEGMAGVLAFQVGSSTFIASKLGVKFPDTDKLLMAPALQNKLELKVNRLDFMAAIRRVRVASDATTSAIGLQLHTPGSLTIFTLDRDGNQASEALACDWDGPVPRTLVVHHEFLTAMLAVHPAITATFRLAQEGKKGKSLVMLQDKDSGTTGVIQQLADTLVK